MCRGFHDIHDIHDIHATTTGYSVLAGAFESIAG